ncbi:unnamed protein product [Moneuplotes crassus]|uniref:Uncharacterized protein n=1 Tax=Euplotes crassus TaxID=5936 RepID=A0AAD1UCV0_EUPCR|nr:unnamed protein product [Moneuplotes crassus]
MSDHFEFDFSEDTDMDHPGRINIQSEGNPFGQENVYYSGAEKASRDMQQIEEVDEATAKHTTNSQRTEEGNRYGKRTNMGNKPKIGFKSSLNEYNPKNLNEPKAGKIASSRFAARHSSHAKTKPANQSFGVNQKSTNMNQEDIIAEITELKKSNRQDLDEIKKLKSEQLKIENLYRRYKEQENDVFTAERILTQNDEVRAFNKANLMVEADKVKKMLMNKIKAGRAKSSFMAKRTKINYKVPAKTSKHDNLVCRSCKMMMNNKTYNEKMIAGAPEDGVNKTIVRIQLKKLKELKSTLEGDLKSKESELERLKQNNTSETEKSVEKELKKSLNILKGLKKKLVKLKQENGSAYDQEIDPVLKAIDKELNKNRKWKNTEGSTHKDHEKDEEIKSKVQNEPLKTKESKAPPPQEVEHSNTVEEEKELKQKLQELEKELDLTDEEFENRLIERLKKEIKTSKTKIEKGLKKEYITKQKEVHKTKNDEIERLKKENDELTSSISRLKILMS